MSTFKDIIQIKVDHPPSYPIFDKLFFDNFQLGRAPPYLHNMKNVRKISKNICKKGLYCTEIHKKYVGSALLKRDLPPPNVKNKIFKEFLKRP